MRTISIQTPLPPSPPVLANTHQLSGFKNVPVGIWAHWNHATDCLLWLPSSCYFKVPPCCSMYQYPSFITIPSCRIFYSLLNSSALSRYLSYLHFGLLWILLWTFVCVGFFFNLLRNYQILLGNYQIFLGRYPTWHSQQQYKRDLVLHTSCLYCLLSLAILIGIKS